MKRQHQRHSIRLRGYDYTQPGAYFVTLCIQNHACLCGDIVDGEMRLSEWGLMIRAGWQDLPNRFPNLKVDEFVVMPDHLHGILVIAAAPPQNETPQGSRPTLSQMVAYYKYTVTKRINAARGEMGTRLFQRNYYEHIIRTPREYNTIRTYIRNNPLNWPSDANAPSRWL